MLLDAVGDFTWCETHGAQVVGRPNLDPVCGGRHQLQGTPYRIVHVHHGQGLIRAQEARVCLTRCGGVVDFYGVIRSPSPRLRTVADQARIADASHVDAEFFVVIPAPILTGLLADPIHRCRVEQRVLRDVLLGRLRTENSDGARPEDPFNPTFLGRFEDIEKGLHVQVPSGNRLFLSGGTQHGGKVIHRVVAAFL